MRLEFTYTIDDYREGLQAHTKKFRVKAISWKWLIGLIVLVPLLIALFDQASGPVAPAAPPAGKGDNPFVGLLAWLGTILSIVIFTRVRWDKKGGGTMQMIRRVILLLALGVAGGVVVFALIPIPRSATGAESGAVHFQDTVRPIAPWLVIIGYIGFMMRSLVIKAYRRAWEGQPMLHQPEVVEIGDETVAFSNPLLHSEYRWFAFQQFTETANLFVLHIGTVSFAMLPKRAFADAAAVDAFRGMVQEKLSRRTGGFPVLAAKAGDGEKASAG